MAGQGYQIDFSFLDYQRPITAGWVDFRYGVMGLTD
jgi:hypothetical protein